MAENDNEFIETLGDGLDILIAPHHCHKSGLPKSIFDITEMLKLLSIQKGVKQILKVPMSHRSIVKILLEKF